VKNGGAGVKYEFKGDIRRARRDRMCRPELDKGYGGTVSLLEKSHG